MTCRFRILIFLLLFGLSGKTQVITEIVSQYDDSIAEWVIYTDDEDLEGLISLKWPLGNNFKEWVFEIGDQSGTLGLKWDNKPDLWELKTSSGATISIRTAWTGDFSEWEFKVGDEKYRLKSRFGRNGLEWVVKDKNREVFAIYMTEEAYPLSWMVEDLFADEGLELIIGLSFIAILHSLG